MSMCDNFNGIDEGHLLLYALLSTIPNVHCVTVQRLSS